MQNHQTMILQTGIRSDDHDRISRPDLPPPSQWRLPGPSETKQPRGHPTGAKLGQTAWGAKIPRIHFVSNMGSTTNRRGGVAPSERGAKFRQTGRGETYGRGRGIGNQTDPKQTRYCLLTTRHDPAWEG